MSTERSRTECSHLRLWCEGGRYLHWTRHRRDGEPTHVAEFLGEGNTLVLQIPIGIHVFVIRDKQTLGRSWTLWASPDRLGFFRKWWDESAGTLLDADVIAGDNSSDCGIRDIDPIANFDIAQPVHVRRHHVVRLPPTGNGTWFLGDFPRRQSLGNGKPLGLPVPVANCDRVLRDLRDNSQLRDIVYSNLAGCGSLWFRWRCAPEASSLIVRAG